MNRNVGLFSPVEDTALAAFFLFNPQQGDTPICSAIQATNVVCPDEAISGADTPF